MRQPPRRKQRRRRSQPAPARGTAESGQRGNGNRTGRTRPARCRALPRRPADRSAEDNARAVAATTGPTAGTALAILDEVDVRGLVPKTGYNRDNFGSGWAPDP